MSDSRFAGKVALVVGGARGIGEATVRAFARNGARVVVVDVDGAAAAAVAAAVGGLAITASADDERAVDAAVRRAVEEYGRIDVVHANAGIGASVRVVDLTLDDWRHVIDVNLTGAFLLARAGMRAMRAQRTGAIVVTSSPHALATNAATAAYAASKAGLLGLVRSLAAEGAEYGVRANAVIPGVIDTPMVRDFVATRPDPVATRERFASMSVFGRLGTAEEVAEAVLFLASDAASFVTGTALCVDGGLLATLPGAIDYD